MAAVVGLIEAPAAGVKSTDLVAGANMASVTTSDTITFTMNRTDDLIFVIAFGTSATVTIAAGSNPPSGRTNGALAITGTTSEVRYVQLESAKYLTSAKPATITMTVAGNTCKIGAFRVARTI